MSFIKLLVFLFLVLVTKFVTAQDSLYVLQATKDHQCFTYKKHNKICLLYTKLCQQKPIKIKGEIFEISDSSITIYQYLKNENVIIPIKDIVRFSRANRSLLRYIGIVAVGSVVTGLLFGNTWSFDTENISLSIIPILGEGFCFYSILPAFAGEFARKHSIKNGWHVATKKYPIKSYNLLQYRNKPKYTILQCL